VEAQLNSVLASALEGYKRLPSHAGRFCFPESAVRILMRALRVAFFTAVLIKYVVGCVDRLVSWITDYFTWCLIAIV
jgi:hypothetical protein